MEHALSEKLRKLSHQLHEFWLVLKVTDKLVFLLDFQAVILQDDFFQVFLWNGLTSIGQIIKRFIVKALCQIHKLSDSRLKVFYWGIPNGKGVSWLVALVKAAVEWAVIEFEGFWFQRAWAVVGCGWQFKGSLFEVLEGVSVFEKSVVLLEHVYEYVFIYTNYFFLSLIYKANWN